MNGFIGNVLNPADGARAQFEPAKIEAVESDNMTSPDFSQNVLNRNLRVFQNDGSG